MVEDLRKSYESLVRVGSLDNNHSGFTFQSLNQLLKLDQYNTASAELNDD